jgi:transposase-like protein
LNRTKVTPSEVVTDAAAVYPGVLDEVVPSAWHHVAQYADRAEADHSQRRHRRRPMRGLRTDRTAQVILAGTPSSRIYVAATTNWDWTYRPAHESPQRSPNSHAASDRDRTPGTAAL